MVHPRVGFGEARRRAADVNAARSAAVGRRAPSLASSPAAAPRCYSRRDPLNRLIASRPPEGVTRETTSGQSRTRIAVRGVYTDATTGAATTPGGTPVPVSTATATVRPPPAGL